MNSDHAGTTTILVQDLLGKVAIGDQNSKDTLFEITRTRFFRLARRMLADYPLAQRRIEIDDLIQSASLRLVRAFTAQVIPTTSREFFGLVTLQLRRVLLDLVDSIRRRPEIPLVPGESSDGPAQVVRENSTNAPDKLAGWSEFHQKVAQLASDEREVFHLRWYQELTLEETAKVMGISVSGVKRLWLKARRNLLTCLDSSSAPDISLPDSKEYQHD